MLASATQCKLYARCPRRWAFAKIGRWSEPKGPALEIGTQLHSVAEKWLRFGQLRGDSEQIKIFQEEIPYLPRPGTCGVEVPFVYVFDDCHFLGFIDAIDWSTRTKIDHKFVGSFDRALAPEDLATDFQSVIYALAPPAWESVSLAWHYVGKRRRECRPVIKQVFLDRAAEVMRREILPLVREMRIYRAAFAGLEGEETVDLINAYVPCEPADCWSFGMHCPHGERCSRRGYREEMEPITCPK